MLVLLYFNIVALKTKNNYNDATSSSNMTYNGAILQIKGGGMTWDINNWKKSIFDFFEILWESYGFRLHFLVLKQKLKGPIKVSGNDFGEQRDFYL